MLVGRDPVGMEQLRRRWEFFFFFYEFFLQREAQSLLGIFMGVRMVGAIGNQAQTKEVGTGCQPRKRCPERHMGDCVC